MIECNSTNFSDLQETSKTVTWKIKNILSQFTEGIDIVSPEFDFHNLKLVLYVPNPELFVPPRLHVQLGRTDDNESEFGGFFKIGLRDFEGYLQYTFESRILFEKQYKWCGSPYGTIRLKELEVKRKKLMFDDILTVVCELRTDDGSLEKRESKTPQKTTTKGKKKGGKNDPTHPLSPIPGPSGTDCATSKRITYIEALAADFGALLKERKNCDVALHIEGDVFKAHKNILGARSPVFAAMFDHDLQESRTDVVTIKDVEPSDFGVLLDFIYSGSVKDLSVERAIGVYAAADKYDLRDMKSHCRDILLDGISKDWFFDIAVLADTHNDGKLMDRVKLFACDIVPCLVSSERCPDFFRDHSMLAAEILRIATSSRFDAKV